MAILSLRQAAQAAGVTRQTIYRYAKQGKLSTVLRDDGSKGVDTSELIRVFGTLREPETDTATVTEPQKVTAGDSGDSSVVLQSQLEAAQEALRTAQEALRQSNSEKDRLLGILESQTRLLEHKPAETAPKKLKRWLRGFFEESE
jgi:predicted transcriptional regulator